MYRVPDLRPTTYTVTSSRPTKRQTSGVRSSTRTVRFAAPWNRRVRARGAAGTAVRSGRFRLLLHVSSPYPGCHLDGRLFV